MKQSRVRKIRLESWSNTLRKLPLVGCDKLAEVIKEILNNK